MTNGQLNQLQELGKCYLVGEDKFYFEFINSTDRKYKLDRWDKVILRRLTHQYRHQVKAMRTNQKDVA